MSTLVSNYISFMSDSKKDCPVCKKTDQVVAIAYGLPGEEMIKKSEEGKIVLGGCVIEANCPHWYCKRDKVSF